jgi:hypothetical protein
MLLLLRLWHAAITATAVTMNTSFHIFVDPRSGSDAAAAAGGGTSNSTDSGGVLLGTAPVTPFRSLARAQDWVRDAVTTSASASAAMLTAVTVHLAAGDYYLGSPLVFTRADSPGGLSSAPVVTYRGPRAGEGEAVISGALLLGQWKQTEVKGVVSTVIPCGIRSRQLYRGEERVPRARSAGEYGVFHGAVTQTATGYITSDTSMGNWETVEGLEFVYPRTLANGTGLYKTFTESRVGVSRVERTPDGRSLNVTMIQPAWSRLVARLHLFGRAAPDARPAWQGLPVWAEGAAELLSPGQWHLDASRCRVLYHGDPTTTGRSGGTVTWRLAVAPRLLEATTVSNLRFERVTFAHSTWLGPEDANGFVEDQGGTHIVRCPLGGCVNESVQGTVAPLTGSTSDGSSYWRTVPAAVAFHGCANIQLKECVFKHIGQTAVSFDTAGGLYAATPQMFIITMPVLCCSVCYF